MSASIFNDVIGPIMRGPSSSHVAGAARIGDIVRQYFASPLTSVICDFDPTGSLAESYTGHGTVIGFPAGLMGIPLTDKRVDNYTTLLDEYGLTIEYRILEYGAEHPGNYRIHAVAADGETHDFEAVALGGGMVELRRIDNYELSIDGGFDELLVEVDLEVCSEEAWLDLLSNMVKKRHSHSSIPGTSHGLCYEIQFRESVRTTNISSERCDEPCCDASRTARHDGISDKPIPGTSHALIQFSLMSYPSEELLAEIRDTPGVIGVHGIHAILPTHSKIDEDVPYEVCEELFVFAQGKKWDAWKYATYYESIRGGKSEDEVLSQMAEIWDVMKQAVRTGLAGTSYDNRVLGPQAHLMSSERVVKAEPINTMIRNITAVMETKSSMGLIVAAPTVGSCGCLPGMLGAFAEVYGYGDEEIVKALMVAGLVGAFFANEATFSAEVGGCQVECGAASGMTAAATASLAGATIEECMNAASVALQNISGLACDPVANRVEVPCLGKNIMAGTNALAASNMILAGYDAVIPLDQTIQAIYEIGLSLPLELRCTYGGLGKTDASNAIREELKKYE